MTVQSPEDTAGMPVTGSFGLVVVPLLAVAPPLMMAPGGQITRAARVRAPKRVKR